MIDPIGLVRSNEDNVWNLAELTGNLVRLMTSKNPDALIKSMVLLDVGHSNSSCTNSTEKTQDVQAKV